MARILVGRSLRQAPLLHGSPGWTTSGRPVRGRALDRKGAARRHRIPIRCRNNSREMVNLELDAWENME